MTSLPGPRTQRRLTVLMAFALLTLQIGCSSSKKDDSELAPPTATKTEAPSVVAASGKKSHQTEATSDSDDLENKRAVTADIQAGIEKHIAAQAAKDSGFFALPFEKRELRLKLVRVHIEYLANLGPERNFACVDLVDTDGEVYDVDFFMSGPPNDMKVTETTVHKINGKPIYAWEQSEQDKTWHRVPMDEASAKLQGVIEGEDHFEFLYKVELPTMPETGRMWLPVPRSDAFQTVEVVSIVAPGTQTRIEDAANANSILVLDLTPADSGGVVEMRYRVSRKEKSSYAEPLEDPGRYLGSNALMPITDEIRKLGAEAVEGKETDLIRARALYDHVMDRMSYKKVGEKWGKGDATYACDSRTGNCSDYHSYFIAVARSVGIPARFAVGAAIPSARDDGGVNGYHCWAEFYADGKWWPIDVSEGPKYSNLSSYYFGHHPANRLELSRGRDLVTDPAPSSGPINFLAHPTLEVGGEYVRIKGLFSFVRSTAPASNTGSN